MKAYLYEQNGNRVAELDIAEDHEIVLYRGGFYRYEEQVEDERKFVFSKVACVTE